MSGVLQLRATNDCPADCGTCHTGSSDAVDGMSLAEIEANLAYFAERHGVGELVLSGGQTLERGDLPALLDLIEAHGYRIGALLTDGLHWTPERVRLVRGRVGRVVVPLSPESADAWRATDGDSASIRAAIRALRRARITVQSNTILRPGAVTVLSEIADAIEAHDVSSPTFTYPFAARGVSDAPPLSELREPLRAVVGRLAARAPRLKNIPPCVLGVLAFHAQQTHPRLYVKEDRQLDNHAVIPPFVGMTFDEACGSCALRRRCDGYWPAHVEAGRIPAPSPRVGRAQVPQKV